MSTFELRVAGLATGICRHSVTRLHYSRNLAHTTPRSSKANGRSCKIGPELQKCPSSGGHSGSMPIASRRKGREKVKTWRSVWTSCRICVQIPSLTQQSAHAKQPHAGQPSCNHMVRAAMTSGGCQTALGLFWKLQRIKKHCQHMRQTKQPPQSSSNAFFEHASGRTLMRHSVNNSKQACSEAAMRKAGTSRF